MKRTLNNQTKNQNYGFLQVSDTKQSIKKAKSLNLDKNNQTQCITSKFAAKVKANQVERLALENKKQNFIKTPNLIKDVCDVSQSRKSLQKYFSFQNYSFEKLTEQHRDSALELLTSSFIQQQPLAVAYYKQFPYRKTNAYQFWSQYWKIYMDYIVQSELSIVIVDTENNDQLVGVFILKDYKYQPENLHNKYLQGLNVLSAEVELENRLIEASPDQIQNILANCSFVAQIWAGAIKNGHQGKGLYFKMTELAQKVLRNAGYEYALVFASNFATSKIMLKLNLTQVAAMDCDEFEMQGSKPFYLLQKIHQRPSLWFKSLKELTLI